MQASDFQEGDVFLDTNFFYNFLRPSSGYKHQIKTFFEQIKVGKIHASTSSSVFDELAYRLLLAGIKDKYSGNPIERLRGQKQTILQEFYPKVQKTLERLKSFPNLEILSVTEAELSQMIVNLTDVNLLPRDALHLAVIINHEIYYIASDDRDFDGIEGIERVWLYNPPLRME